AGGRPRPRDGRGGGNEELGAGRVQLRRRAEAGAVVQRGRHGGGDTGVTVAEDQRAPGADVVEVAVAVEVDEVRPLTLGDEDGLAADAAEGAGRTIDATGDQVAGAAVGLLAAGAVHARDTPFTLAADWRG